VTAQFRWLGFHGGPHWSEGDAYFIFFVWRCRERNFDPAYARGPEWLWEYQGRKYGPRLTAESLSTPNPLVVNTWRHSGQPGDQWADLGFTYVPCL
jgi:hypothetical protein